MEISLYIQIKRIIYTGISNIIRNPFVSFSAIFVMTVTLFVVGFSLLLGQMVNDVVDSLEEKVDVTVYFVPGTPEDQIFEFKTKLDRLDSVREVIYVSQDSALEEYKTRHSNSPRLLEGLELIDGENPFRARFSIRAKETSDFEAIAQFLQNEDVLSDNPTTIIDKIDYYQNREVINRLASIINTSTKFMTTIILILIIISFLIVFNIVRLIIYLSKSEISVMKLIGASDFYINSPFLVSGSIYGFTSSIISVLLLYPVYVWLSPAVSRFFGNDIVFSTQLFEFVILSALVIVVGIALGIISSWLSARRYL